MRGNRAERDGVIDISLAKNYLRLLIGLSLALGMIAVLIMANNPGAKANEKTMLSQALLSDRVDLQIDSEELASRVVDQKFQIHMEEMDQQMGEIPYVEIWVLNDPFYPLMGEVGDLRSNEGTLSGKEWQMLGFPDYEAVESGTTTGAPAGSPTSSLPVTTDVTQRVVLVEEIYEMRGIMYADIKVNDTTYDKLKAGSEFAEVFRLQEIKDGKTALVLCGDESYELQVNQLRKI
ncbi:MAG: hypothetical protein C4536_09915 [Actinobacteria bacterium]|jgi:hypothetical protein|nr:MAG: hypothetical protein C4536_09915 [Actinomycetota bacterium]